jgi:hypothetical protein
MALNEMNAVEVEERREPQAQQPDTVAKAAAADLNTSTHQHVKDVDTSLERLMTRPDSKERASALPAAAAKVATPEPASEVRECVRACVCVRE